MPFSGLLDVEQLRERKESVAQSCTDDGNLAGSKRPQHGVNTGRWREEETTCLSNADKTSDMSNSENT